VNVLNQSFHEAKQLREYKERALTVLEEASMNWSIQVCHFFLQLDITSHFFFHLFAHSSLFLGCSLSQMDKHGLRDLASRKEVTLYMENKLSKLRSSFNTELRTALTKKCNTINQLEDPSELLQQFDKTFKDQAEEDETTSKVYYKVGLFSCSVSFCLPFHLSSSFQSLSIPHFFFLPTGSTS
jgi:hypothetical protein